MRDARHHGADVCKSFTLARAHAHMPEPARNFLSHNLLAEACQVGPVWDLEPNPDGYCQQEEKKRKPVFAECLPREKEEEAQRNASPFGQVGSSGKLLGPRGIRGARSLGGILGGVRH
jgi:hypothetical protein